MLSLCRSGLFSPWGLYGQSSLLNWMWTSRKHKVSHSGDYHSSAAEIQPSSHLSLLLPWRQTVWPDMTSVNTSPLCGKNSCSHSCLLTLRWFLASAVRSTMLCRCRQKSQKTSPQEGVNCPAFSGDTRSQYSRRPRAEIWSYWNVGY